MTIRHLLILLIILAGGLVMLVVMHRPTSTSYHRANIIDQPERERVRQGLAATHAKSTSLPSAIGQQSGKTEESGELRELGIEILEEQQQAVGEYESLNHYRLLLTSTVPWLESTSIEDAELSSLAFGGMCLPEEQRVKSRTELQSQALREILTHRDQLLLHAFCKATGANALGLESLTLKAETSADGLTTLEVHRIQEDGKLDRCVRMFVSAGRYDKTPKRYEDMAIAKAVVRIRREWAATVLRQHGQDVKPRDVPAVLRAMYSVEVQIPDLQAGPLIGRLLDFRQKGVAVRVRSGSPMPLK